MKVKELIEHLQKFDPEQIVLVDGYETGFDEVHHVQYIAGLSKSPEDKPYYDGEYHKMGSLSKESDNISAVYLPRSS
jgi:hypothetical protein